jgi:hypothetical protein
MRYIDDPQYIDRHVTVRISKRWMMQCNAIAGVNKFVTGYMQNIGIIYANQQVQKYYTDKRDYTPDMRLLQNYFSNLPMKKLNLFYTNTK